MTIPAQKLKIVRVKRDRRVADVVRGEMDAVVHDLAGLVDPACQASLTQAADLLEI